MRRGLTKEQIKEIADRAEGKEPEYELRTFVCKSCQHEIVVNPDYPKYETPVYCTPCIERARDEKRKADEKPFDPEQFNKVAENWLNIFDKLQELKKTIEEEEKKS